MTEEFRQKTIQDLEALLRSILEECGRIMEFIEELKKDYSNQN
jgi:hypothetical protein